MTVVGWRIQSAKNISVEKIDSNTPLNDEAVSLEGRGGTERKHEREKERGGGEERREHIRVVVVVVVPRRNVLTETEFFRSFARR